MATAVSGNLPGPARSNPEAPATLIGGPSSAVLRAVGNSHAGSMSERVTRMRDRRVSSDSSPATLILSTWTTTTPFLSSFLTRRTLISTMSLTSSRTRNRTTSRRRTGNLRSSTILTNTLARARTQRRTRRSNSSNLASRMRFSQMKRGEVGMTSQERPTKARTLVLERMAGRPTSSRCSRRSRETSLTS